MHYRSYVLNNLEDSSLLAYDVCQLLSQRNIKVVCLKGDLGAGKTTLSSLIINLLSHSKQIVTSPTFNIVKSYDTHLGMLHHYDLYRLKHEAELHDIGILDFIEQDICLIEWPDLIKPYLNNYLEIDIKLEEKSRRAELYLI